MKLSHEKLKDIFKSYHRFDDGLLLSFEYFYKPNCPLSAKIVLLAKNHSHPQNLWMKVTITLEDVGEIAINTKGNSFNSISAGVKLLRFDDLYCIDIDGEYDLTNDPTSMNEVRENGECYVTAKDILISEEIYKDNE